ncbi:hypothetical protein N9N67_03795 [Bacteriovoracaceae bacterium]|nr:hypothetical protein [Bacteriovoracaceae bacterium]
MKARNLLLTTALSLTMNLSFSDSLEDLTGRKFKETETYQGLTEKSDKRQFRRGRKDYNSIRKGYDQMQEGAGEMHGLSYEKIDDSGNRTTVIGSGLMEKRSDIEDSDMSKKDKRKALRPLKKQSRRATRLARRGNREVSKKVKGQSKKMLKYLRKNYKAAEDSPDMQGFYDKFFNGKPNDAQKAMAGEVYKSYQTARSNKTSKKGLKRLFHGKKKVRKDFLEAMDIDSKKQRKKWATGKLETETENKNGLDRYNNALDFIQLGNPNYMKFLETGKLDMISNRKKGDGVESATGDILGTTPSKLRERGQLTLAKGEKEEERLGETLATNDETNLAGAENDPNKTNVSSTYKPKVFKGFKSNLAKTGVKVFDPKKKDVANGKNAKNPKGEYKTETPGRKGFSDKRVKAYNATKSSGA